MWRAGAAYRTEGELLLRLAEARYAERVPADSAAYLSSGRVAGRQAALAGVGHLVLTHLQPGTDPDAAVRAAGSRPRCVPGLIGVATAGLTVNVLRIRRWLDLERAQA